MHNFHFKEKYDIEDLLGIMHILRSPGGCPWDIEQTHLSISRNLIEEAYEVLDAIDSGDSENLCEELGDLLLQIVFHIEIENAGAEGESGGFSFEDVCDGVCKKLITRHPHVFGDKAASTADEVLRNWDAIKRESKAQTYTDTLTGVPRSFPALMRAAKLQKRAARAGFDWDSADGPMDKLYEELGELKEAVGHDDVAEELGDLLFSAVNLSRFVGADAERALAAACDKFISRFALCEQMATDRGIDMSRATLEQLDALWDEAKLGSNRFRSVE